jgi:hypothetical protein
LANSFTEFVQSLAPFDGEAAARITADTFALSRRERASD